MISLIWCGFLNLSKVCSLWVGRQRLAILPVHKRQLYPQLHIYEQCCQGREVSQYRQHTRAFAVYIVHLGMLPSHLQLHIYKQCCRGVGPSRYRQHVFSIRGFAVYAIELDLLPSHLEIIVWRVRNDKIRTSCSYKYTNLCANRQVYISFVLNGIESERFF